MESDAFRAALLDYAQALGSAFPTDEAALAEVWARVAALDAARLARLREDLSPDDPALAEALLTLLRSSTAAEARLEGFREAVAIRTRVFGPNDYRTHDALSEVARVLSDAGRYDEADAVRALADPELQTGRSPLDATIDQATTGNLFALFYGVGEFAMAQTAAEERLAKALQDYGRRSLEAGVAAHELGSVLMVRGPYAEAEPFLKAAAEIIVAEVRPVALPTLLSDPGNPYGWFEAAVANYRYAGILGNLGSGCCQSNGNLSPRAAGRAGGAEPIRRASYTQRGRQSRQRLFSTPVLADVGPHLASILTHQHGQIDVACRPDGHDGRTAVEPGFPKVATEGVGSPQLAADVGVTVTHDVLTGHIPVQVHGLGSVHGYWRPDAVAQHLAPAAGCGAAGRWGDFAGQRVGQAEQSARLGLNSPGLQRQDSEQYLQHGVIPPWIGRVVYTPLPVRTWRAAPHSSAPPAP